MGIRRRGREYALQMLYAMDVNEYLPEEVFQGFKTIQDLNQEAFANAKTLVLGVHQHHEIIDQMIQNFAEHWKIARMVVVDRNLLRLGLYELMHCPDIPYPIIINESLEIAKEFSDPDSTQFLNGILDSARKHYRSNDIVVRRRPKLKTGSDPLAPPFNKDAT